MCNSCTSGWTYEYFGSGCLWDHLALTGWAPLRGTVGSAMSLAILMEGQTTQCMYTLSFNLAITMITSLFEAWAFLKLLPKLREKWVNQKFKITLPFVYESSDFARNCVRYATGGPRHHVINSNINKQAGLARTGPAKPVNSTYG